MLYILLLKSFFQMGGGRRKERSESSWDAVSATQGSTITPARTSLGLCPEQSPFLLSCKPTKKKLVPQVTLWHDNLVKTASCQQSVPA